MSKRPAKPNEPDDAELLREALKGVSPLPDSGRVVHRPRKPEPVAGQTARDEAEVLRESLADEMPVELMLESGDDLAYLREGIDRQVLRRLRRGHWVVQDHLDLHGLRVEEARDLLVSFLNESLKCGRRCVRIVHGKGYRSPNREPVLKRKTAAWLRQRDEVLAYCQAPPADGGGGALLVLLKSK
jgi:DNA-nicking Smr family endonuclease